MTNRFQDKITVLFSDSLWALTKSMPSSYREKLDKKRYRVSNTSLSYRQINYLDNAGLLGKERDSDQKNWRTFRIKDLLYLNILAEIKNFDMRNSKLRPLHALFYLNGEWSTDQLLVACLHGIEITLEVYQDGSIALLDAAHAHIMNDLANKKHIPRITILINDLFDNMSKNENNIERKPISLGKTLEISDREKKIIEHLRDNEFKTIKIIKKSGRPYLMKASSEHASTLDKASILSLINKYRFADIEITKNDGKVVHLKHSKTTKL